MRKKKLWLIPALSIPLVLIAVFAVFIFPQLKTGGEAPSVQLEVYGGPDFSESDGLYYYRIEAIASGTPEPEIAFEDDEHIRQLGPERVEVAVEAGESYDLRATATNPSGTATATITLSGEWGQEQELAEKEKETGKETEKEAIADENIKEEATVEGTAERTAAEETTEGIAVEGMPSEVEENRPPVITGNIIIESLPGDDTPDGGPYKAGQVHYRVRVIAEDPDGDPLTYSWSGGGGYGYSDSNANPTEWITPDRAATYYLHVRIRDGRGGVSDAGLNVRVAAAVAENRPPEITGTIIIIGPISGQPITADYVYTRQEYVIRIEASDPDGHDLYYEWILEGNNCGTITDTTANPTIWRTPIEASGQIIDEWCYISVWVRDSWGGLDGIDRHIHIVTGAGI